MAAIFVENMRFEEPKADLPLIDKKSVTNIIRLVLQGNGFLQNKLSRFIAENSQAGKGAWLLKWTYWNYGEKLMKLTNR